MTYNTCFPHSRRALEVVVLPFGNLQFHSRTSSIIQALLLFKRLHPGHREKEIETAVSKAIHFLEGKQWPDGSW